jgi:hypothetical protein
MPSHRIHLRLTSSRVTGVVAGLVLFLALVGQAGAGTRSDARLAAVVARVAGRPVAVSCERNGIAWSREVAAVDAVWQVVAYYDPEPDAIRFGPVICDDIARPGVSLASVRALFIAAHEAAHAAGVDDEGVANCWGVYWAQELARVVYGVEFFTKASMRVLSYARQIQRDSPPEYRAACPV